MRVLMTRRELERELRRLIASCTRMRWCVAWASHAFPLFDLLRRHPDKIQQLTVGIHFYQTHPEFIAAFMDHECVSFVMHPNGVFHPKLYFFENENAEWECIIGSPNFTHGAFTNNVEVGVLIGSRDVGAAAAHRDILNGLQICDRDGRRLTQTELSAYRSLWKNQQRRLLPLSGEYSPSSRDARPAQSPLNASLFVAEWAEYFTWIREEEEQDTEERLAVLEAARHMFAGHPHFSDLDDESRKLVAGFARTEALNWLWFGSMKGAGYFKQAINSNHADISAALDAIPITGAVTEEHFLEYTRLFMNAFKQSGIATATRLLAMKRPDYFLCLDSKNRDMLCDAFSISKSVDVDGYWQQVIERLTDSIWWNSPEPKHELERRVWKCRAAFLDARFYDRA